ncbi:vacuolar protein sorting protein-like protein [Piedraia hortae CBS 480.64]|uniref:Vacuolar protein-sorting-associated protein 36 n=1 Tax=Piedraia hortae CBS 480.64 TaxID=1314780 RepID=A0A6A7CAZ4_9PEZI|nr:vacuolar protein sorting protein-like protein [Piedraia hortae CBS 480.64]
MFLSIPDLTTALRPHLLEDEALLCVQGGIGLYKGKSKLLDYQDGQVYLTSHRLCYVDNKQPRRFSISINLKDLERVDLYAGFLKSSPKIILGPKSPKWPTVQTSAPDHRSPDTQVASQARGNFQRPPSSSASNLNATWICPICGFSNSVPATFDPATANQSTPLPLCQACGIKPPLALIIKSAIAAMSKRPIPRTESPKISSLTPLRPPLKAPDVYQETANTCPRCTFHNHPSLAVCEMCGASLQPSEFSGENGPSIPSVSPDIHGEVNDVVKLSFRTGGEKDFLERLKAALAQQKWLQQNPSPTPRSIMSVKEQFQAAHLSSDGRNQSPASQQRLVGVAGLERKGIELRQTNQEVIGSAFEDLEALMTSAKEVIAMAEQFATQNAHNDSAADRSLILESTSALGLTTTKDMISDAGLGSEALYIKELSRNLAEFLTDDRRGILRHEGGIMPLVDLWAVFNRTRNGIELVSPRDFEKAALKWNDLNLPIRLRRFKSGLLVVQERSRTDGKTIEALLSWLQEPQMDLETTYQDHLGLRFGRGVTAQEAAERFGWSVGVAAEELEMAEDTGALCRDQSLDGIRFWENQFFQLSNAQESDVQTSI